MTRVRSRPALAALLLALLLTSGAVLLLTSASFLAHEFSTFRYSTVRSLSTLGQVIATKRTPWPASPGRVFRVPSSVLDDVDPDRGNVIIGVVGASGTAHSRVNGFGSARLGCIPRSS